MSCSLGKLSTLLQQLPIQMGLILRMLQLTGFGQQKVEGKPNSPFLSGAFDDYNTYTITPARFAKCVINGKLADLQHISVEDHAGNIEYFQKRITGPTQEVPSEAPNSARSDYTYNDLIENMESVGLGDPRIIDKINVLANDHVGKWGGALGSAPVQQILKYSITDAGALTYSDVQLVNIVFMRICIHSPN